VSGSLRKNVEQGAFFSPRRTVNTDLPVETRARFPKKFQHPIENAFKAASKLENSK
jgi:hypothetical protein